MPDFYELERKYKKLQAKKILKILLLVLFGVFILGLIVGFMKYQPKLFNSQPPKTKVIIKEKNITKVVVKKIYVEKNITKPEQNLSIDIDFNDIKNIKPKPKKISPKIKHIIKKQPHTKTTIVDVKSEVITFKKAMVLANEYYDIGEYQNSIKWCKIAAKIDNENEKVWKLYALNLYKIGNTQKAIEILKTYLKYRDSQELRYLLQRFEK